MTEDGFSNTYAFLSDDGELPDVESNRTRPIGDEPPSEVVVQAVADALGRDPLELPPLHNVIDADALDDLFADTPTGAGRTGRFAFEYCGCVVALFGSGEVAVDASD